MQLYSYFIFTSNEKWSSNCSSVPKHAKLEDQMLKNTPVWLVQMGSWKEGIAIWLVTKTPSCILRSYSHQDHASLIMNDRWTSHTSCNKTNRDIVTAQHILSQGRTNTDHASFHWDGQTQRQRLLSLWLKGWKARLFHWDWRAHKPRLLLWNWCRYHTRFADTEVTPPLKGTPSCCD